MADFRITHASTKGHEGGYWNDPSAGPTYAGITKRYYPEWPGHAYVVALGKKQFGNKPIPRYTKFKDATLDKMIEDFYKKNFWDKKLQGDYIANQTLANFLFDFVFHKEEAIRVINAVAKSYYDKLKTDNSKISFDVINVMNNNLVTFYAKMLAARIKYYFNPAAFGLKSKFSQAAQKEFIARVNKFPKQVTA